MLSASKAERCQRARRSYSAQRTQRDLGLSRSLLDQSSEDGKTTAEGPEPRLRDIGTNNALRLAREPETYKPLCASTRHSPPPATEERDTARIALQWLSVSRRTTSPKAIICAVRRPLDDRNRLDTRRRNCRTPTLRRRHVRPKACAQCCAGRRASTVRSWCGASDGAWRCTCEQTGGRGIARVRRPTIARVRSRHQRASLKLPPQAT